MPITLRASVRPPGSIWGRRSDERNLGLKGALQGEPTSSQRRKLDSCTYSPTRILCSPPGPTRRNPGFRAAGLAIWWASVQLGRPVCHRDDKRVTGGAAGTLEMQSLGQRGLSGWQGFHSGSCQGQAANSVGSELKSPG